MYATTQNIDIIPVLQDAEIELSQLDAIEVAPMPEGGIELIDRYSDSMIESDYKKHRIYLCQSDTGYFCDLAEAYVPGRIGRTGEVLTPGPEDEYFFPLPFLSDGLPEDELVVVICNYAEEQHTGRVDFGTRITIYTPQPEMKDPDNMPWDAFHGSGPFPEG